MQLWDLWYSFFQIYYDDISVARNCLAKLKIVCYVICISFAFTLSAWAMGEKSILLFIVHFAIPIVTCSCTCCAGKKYYCISYCSVRVRLRPMRTWPFLLGCFFHALVVALLHLPYHTGHNWIASLILNYCGWSLALIWMYGPLLFAIGKANLAVLQESPVPSSTDTDANNEPIVDQEIILFNFEDFQVQDENIILQILQEGLLPTVISNLIFSYIKTPSIETIEKIEFLGSGTVYVTAILQKQQGQVRLEMPQQQLSICALQGIQCNPEAEFQYQEFNKLSTCC